MVWPYPSYHATLHEKGREMDDGDGNEGGEDDDDGRRCGRVTRVVGPSRCKVRWAVLCVCVEKGSAEEKSRQRSISGFSIILSNFLQRPEVTNDTRDAGRHPVRDSPMITNTGSRNFVKWFK
jgi:hypothetical protein